MAVAEEVTGADEMQSLKQILVGSETFSARESPNFTFKLGQTCRNLNSDNGDVILNVGEVDLPNALLTLELRVI